MTDNAEWRCPYCTRNCVNEQAEIERLREAL